MILTGPMFTISTIRYNIHMDKVKKSDNYKNLVGKAVIKVTLVGLEHFELLDKIPTF